MKRSNSPLELWGGVECTLNRVGDRYFDQLTWNGHYDRLEDLERFAELGLKALRYPVLWERWGAEKDWSWLDRRLERLGELGIRPILGLVHHGSGPPHTSLLRPDFATGLAEFAERVARRYPWVTDYTPVNEPLTTARFSALYGHWYPHARDDRSFLQALVQECRATSLAMTAIRAVQPGARLVQTEDLGRTHSVPGLRYQADFENQRRWLSFDLLCGRVRPGHPLLHYVLDADVDLNWQPCPPDLLGVNYYATSERFLDVHLEAYPEHLHGGNGRHRYVDTEAVRVNRALGAQALLLECWRRYRIPIAITEAHIGCTREEQVRWLWEMWQAAEAAREDGADVRAVTAWALLGSFDWSSLVTRPRGHYEPGAFDVRSQPPRPTAVARALHQLSQGQKPDGPSLHTPGWWRARASAAGPPLLVLGSGSLAKAFLRMGEKRGLATETLPSWPGRRAMQEALEGWKPWAVVAASGYVEPDQAEADELFCFRDSVVGPQALAAECERRRLQLLFLSSDQVFDGLSLRPYHEGDPVGPLNVLGRCHADGERAVRDTFEDALVVRASACFCPQDERGFLVRMLRQLAQGECFPACPRTTVSPTCVSDLADACLDLLLDRESGLWHLSNVGQVTWLDLARRLARLAGLDPGRVGPGRTWTAPRPAYSALQSRRGSLLPSLDDALERFWRAIPPRPRPLPPRPALQPARR